MKRPSFSRVFLPAIAVIGIAGSVIYIASSQPDRSLANPVETPAKTPAAQRQSGSVVGTGVVEPSSETVDIAAHVSGVVARVFVRPGDQVAAGQPLLEIDSRTARAAVSEAAAQAATARQSPASTIATRLATASAMACSYAFLAASLKVGRWLLGAGATGVVDTAVISLLALASASACSGTLA